MTHNALSPGFIRLRYTGFSLTHWQTIPVDPGGAIIVGQEPTIATNSAGNLDMGTVIDEYVEVIKVLFGNTVTFVDAEYWSQPLPDDDPIWVYTHPVGVVGTNATASAPERQHVISYRTTLGGMAFHYLMEVSGGIAGSLRQNFPTTSAGTNALNAYLLGTTGFFKGRDGGKFITPVWFTTKNNDAIRKRLLNL